MNYDLSKHKEIREAVVNHLQSTSLTELPGGVWSARIAPFPDDVDQYPVASVFTGNDNSDETPDEQNLNREYDVDILIISKGYDVTDTGSGQESFIDKCDAAAKAIENALGGFRFNLGAVVYRLKYSSSVMTIDNDGALWVQVRIATWKAISKEKKVGAPG